MTIMTHLREIAGGVFFAHRRGLAAGEQMDIAREQETERRVLKAVTLSTKPRVLREGGERI
jgi:hypothetical protein